MIQKVHLDTDLGGDIDDLCALAMVLKWPETEIVGVTVVGDKNGKRTGYVRYVLGLVGKNNISVAAGADCLGGFYRYNLGIPPESRYWPDEITAKPGPVDDALYLLKQSIDLGAIIIGIGPLTNFFLLERKYPGILKSAKLFLMGGFVYPIRPGFPDWKNEFDFNIQIDVKSSEYVLDNSSPTLIPLSVTAETFLRRQYLPRLKKGDVLEKLIADQAESFAEDEQMEEKYGKTCENLPEDIINFQHDALACAVALGYNDGVEIKDLPLVFEEKEGFMTERIDYSLGRSTKVVTKIDGRKFSKFWLNRVLS